MIYHPLSKLWLQTLITPFPGINGYYNRLNSQFGSCLEQEKTGLDGYAKSSQETFGTYLTLWNDYVSEESAMLQRRATLVHEVDVANRALAKATISGKPAKTAAALAIKEQRDKDLKSATAQGETEVRRFHQQRLSEMKESLTSYAQEQLKVAKDTHKKLEKCLVGLKGFELPPKSLLSSGINPTLRSYEVAKNMHIPE